MVVLARTHLFAGLALGLNPQLMKDDPILTQAQSPSRYYQATFGSEGARLNLNYVLLSKNQTILVNLFTQWGLSIDQATHVAACLYDWVTPGDQKSLDGAKAQDYVNANLPQVPTYQPFDSFDEVELVMDFGLVEKVRPNWQDSFTLWSNGPLNVNEAPPELIANVPSVEGTSRRPTSSPAWPKRSTSWSIPRRGARRCRRCAGHSSRPTSWPPTSRLRGIGPRRSWCAGCSIRWATASRRRPSRTRERHIQTVTVNSATSTTWWAAG